MKSPLCVIRDQLVGYMNPFIATNEDVAMRDFKVVINDDKSMMYHNPAHFDLYRIGEFDSNTGIIDPCEPTIICTGLSVWRDDHVQD